ncbi:hypothetical protein OS493_033418 [Desmophyllum pertusum]|uniref:Uncharacterized protein n=2 Tax=Desmophyllum pertusum TaxID=174260 RepID=A0A9W9YB91_9CNID|nr:hypothetical protein OS493_033418 [Desmophyllum pertusum]
MNKKRFTEFASYVEGFTQRIIIHFPNAKDFVDNEKKEMLEKFPELATSSNPSSRQSQFDVVKYTLDSSVNNERRMCYHDVEIKMNSPEECVETINTLARAVGNAHRDILYYSSIQGQILSTLKDCCGQSFTAILRNNINISKSHAYFLMKFHKLALEYPRLLKCELPLSYFQKTLQTLS